MANKAPETLQEPDWENMPLLEMMRLRTAVKIGIDVVGMDSETAYQSALKLRHDTRVVMGKGDEDDSVATLDEDQEFRLT